LSVDGYAIEHDGLCTTVFSAPNYVDQGGNKGAFVSELELDFQTEYADIPFHRSVLMLREIGNTLNLKHNLTHH
jgi:hypothetical protein